MFDYPMELEIIFDKLKKYNIKPVLVGGYIRDYHLGIDSKDIDIELYNANSFEEILEILKEFGKPNIIGKNFGVIKLNLENIDIDFSLPRLDNKISNGHKGFKVSTFSNMDFKKASFRRDFTINAIGYDVFEKKTLDPYNGLSDLKNKTLKYINKNSFQEDPLRVLRAVQFCARFNLKCDNHLFNLCKEMVYDNLLDELPKERIYEEIKKLLLKSNNPSIGFNLLFELGALNILYDKIILKQFKDNIIFIDKFITNNTTNKESNLVIMLALLYYKMPKSFEKLFNKKKFIKEINSFYHISEYFLGERSNILYSIAKDININNLKLFLQTINLEIDLTCIKPLIHGKDLIKRGYKISKDFSTILQDIYEKQILKNFTE